MSAVSVDEAPDRGIDLAAKAQDVARIFYWKFGSMLAASGYDLDDVLQAVYWKILRLNRTEAAFDPSRASLSRYVILVASSVVRNHHRLNSRIASREAAMPTRPDGTEIDYIPGQVAVRPGIYGSEGLAHEAFTEFLAARTNPVSRIQKLALEIVPLVLEGHNGREIGELIGVGKGVAGCAVAHIRAEARAWASSTV